MTFVDSDKSILKFIWKFKRSRITKIISLKGTERNYTTSPMSSYCNTTAVKTVWDCPKDGQMVINATDKVHKEIRTYTIS